MTQLKKQYRIFCMLFFDAKSIAWGEWYPPTPAYIYIIVAGFDVSNNLLLFKF